MISFQFFINGASAQFYEVSDSLIFTESIGLNRVINITVSDSLTFTQTIDYQNYHRVVNDTLHISEIIGISQLKNISVSDTLTFSESLSRIRSFPTIDVSDTLSLSQTLSNYAVKIRNITNTLNLSESLDKIRISGFNVIDSLNLIENVNRNVIFARQVTDTFIIQTGYITRKIENVYVTYPDIIVMKATTFVLLQSSHGVIILPDPIFGDGQQNNDELNIKRAVDGTAYTFVKTTARQKLKYAFEIKRKKAIELKQFVDLAYLDQISLTNWKGELWSVYLMNNPVTFTASSRGYICTGNEEAYSVALDFEGFKISGGNDESNCS